jgi:hypothetical protein
MVTPPFYGSKGRPNADPDPITQQIKVYFKNVENLPEAEKWFSFVNLRIAGGTEFALLHMLNYAGFAN